MRLALPLLLFVVAPLLAGPQDAVVRINSNGGSGTVIWTAPGKTYVLSSNHMFTSQSKRDKVVIHAPTPNPNNPAAGNSRCIAVDPDADLALVLMQVGPLPYVCPVAPPGHRPGRLLSVGYDNLKWPSQQKPTHLLGPQIGQTLYTSASYCEEPVWLTARDECFTLTRELPWHGRSGGGLIDVDNGVLVGVVSGYRGTSPKAWSEVKPGACGVYSSHSAVLSFLRRHAPETLTASGQQQPQGIQQYIQPQEQQPYYQPNPYYQQSQPQQQYKYYQSPRSAPQCLPGGT